MDMSDTCQCHIMMITIDETFQENEFDTIRKEEQEKRTDGTKIGGDMGNV